MALDPGILRKLAWTSSMMMTGTHITREVVKCIVLQTRFIFQLMDRESLLLFRYMMTLNQTQAGPNSQQSSLIAVVSNRTNYKAIIIAAYMVIPY